MSLIRFFEQTKRLFTAVVGTEKVKCALDIGKGILCLVGSQGWSSTCVDMIFDGVQCLICKGSPAPHHEFMRLTHEQSVDAERLPEYQELLVYARNIANENDVKESRPTAATGREQSAVGYAAFSTKSSLSSSQISVVLISVLSLIFIIN